MNSPKIEDIILSELKLIPGELGSVRHGIKSTDPGFSGFEEVYFSSVFFGKTKGWKRHTRMISNLIVISGEITFFLIDKREDSRTYDQNDIIRISADNPRRLTVPPGIWTAFRGNTQGENVLCNVANLMHDPEESETLSISDPQFRKILEKE